MFLLLSLPAGVLPQRQSKNLSDRRLVCRGVRRLADLLQRLLRPLEQAAQIAPKLLHVKYRVALAGEDLQIGVVELIVKGPQGLPSGSWPAFGLLDQSKVRQKPLTDHHTVHLGKTAGKPGAVLRS